LGCLSRKGLRGKYVRKGLLLALWKNHLGGVSRGSFSCSKYGERRLGKPFSRFVFYTWDKSTILVSNMCLFGRHESLEPDIHKIYLGLEVGTPDALFLILYYVFGCDSLDDVIC
jgi:hypothetical protein